jgi:large subunit ribosomal protein L17
MVTLGKRGDLAAHRRAYAFLGSHGAVKKLFDEIAPQFKERPGGYTRIVKFGVRRGDAAPISVIEFTGASEAAPARKKRRKTESREQPRGARRAAAAAG